MPNVVGLAATSSNRTALVFGDRRLSQREFAGRVSVLARQLITEGVGPDVAVAVVMPRSVELLVAIHAVTAAGGHYMPVDTDAPADRVEYLLSTSAAKIALVKAGAVLPAGLGAVQLVEVDADTAVDLDSATAAPVTDADRISPLRGDHAAYTLFTSGSTGRPKGVTVSHRAIVNRLEWMRDWYSLDATDVFLQKTPVTFDVSVWELFLPFTVGATLVVAEPDRHGDPSYIADVIESKSVTAIHFVPSMLSAFADVLGERLTDLTSLRVLFTSGEALTTAVSRAVLTALPQLELHNLYGPTEAAVDVTAQQVTVDDPTVPIGVPVPHTSTFVLDPRLQLVPRGVPGELYLGGVQLARGYAARPDLTAERFVADPFGEPGDRLYRTGDLVRWNSAGRIEYLGRTDFQVKLRGQRLELGEIEAVVSSAPGVVHAAASVAKLPAGDQLVAYLAPRTVDVDAVKAVVAARLPEYMRPTVWMTLDEMPLGSAGKVNRRKLPAPELVAAEHVEPAEGVETQIALVYAAVLGADRVSAAESFFDLGGNSLAATRLAARIAAALDVDVTVRDVFDAPSVRELAAALSGRGRSVEALTSRERPQRLPLSTAQQRMWFINQFDTDSAAYNIPMGLALSGEIDLPALGDALGDVLERHEVLRTIYPSDTDGPFQQVLGADQARAAFVWAESADLDGLVESASRGFDVSADLPIRGAFRQTETGADLVITAHHIAFDGESTPVFVRDLLAAYLRRTGAAAEPQPPLDVQYADFALWQRDVLGSSDDVTSPLGRQTAYWREQLVDLPAVTDLPMDRSRPAVLDTAGAVLSVDVDEALAAGVDRLARAHGATGFMVTHAALAITVARLASTTDVVIGSPIAGRTDAALDDLVGMFVNTLVLRTPVDSAQTVADFLDEVRSVDLDAFANADVQFDDLIDDLAPERSTSHQPLVQIAFTHTAANNRADLGPIELPGLTASPLSTAEAFAKFDLTVAVSEATAERPMRADFLYATTLFDEATVALIADAWVQVIAAMITDAAIATGDIDLVGTPRVVKSRNSVGGTTPAIDGGASVPAPLPDLLAARHVDPSHPALICDGQTVSYGEFDQRTDAVARTLIGRGVRPDDVVAVGLERSIASVVAVFGVIKSGAAYVPIDPAYPQDRIDYMVSDSGVRLGLTDAATRPRLGEGDCEWIDVDSLATGSSSATATLPVTAVSVDNLAYLVYTSGSTGRPKAVGVSHRGMANFIDQFREVSGTPADAPDTRVLHVASPSFDASVLEMMWSIGLGHTLVIAPASEYAGDALGRVLDRDAVTDTLITPTVLATVDPARGRTIRNLVTGGEACPPELINRWTTPTGATRTTPTGATRTMYNFYGPSEATVWSLTGVSVPGQPVTIGHPVRGFAAYVLDNRLHQVPRGVVGELYLASDDSLARGYLGRPGQTSGAFVADPFSSTPGARMYATGDLVRVNSRGEVEFAGRADHQVKINGQRVELGEIEAVLQSLPSVDSTVVIGAKDVSGRSRLVAYLVPAAGQTIDTGAVLAEAGHRLAAHMVPHVAVVLDELPLTPGGKLDRRALSLRAPDELDGVLGGDNDIVAPASAAEEALAAIVSGLLGRDRVGVTDSFFGMGGDSIMSIQLASAARAAGIELTPREIFEHKTVRGMARAAAAGAIRLPMIDEPGGAPTGSMPLPPIVSWLIDASPTPTDLNDFNQAMVLTAPDGLTVDRLAAVLGAVVDAHPMLSAVLERGVDGHWTLTSGGPFDPASAMSTADDIVAAHAADASRLDPSAGAMVRASIVGDRVVLTVHHLAVDAVSWPILIEDLVTAWAHHSTSQPVSLRSEVSSARAWATALDAHAADRAGELDYWLARAPHTANPLDSARGAGRGVEKGAYSATESLVHRVEPAIAAPLVSEVPDAFGGATTDVLLAALATAVRDWQSAVGIADDGPVAILSEGHGRYEDVLADAEKPTRADLSRTVGWFTTIAPILVDPALDPVHAVKAVKEERLAQPGHGVGYGLLRYRASTELSTRPLPSIAFNYLGGSGTVVDGPEPAESAQDVGFLPAPDAPFLPSVIDSGLEAMAPLVINASTVAGPDGPTLSADFRYSSTILSGDDVRQITENWTRTLAEIVAASRTDVGLSPSDVPGSGVTQTDLDTISAAHPGCDIWPLTPLQRGLYFQSQLAGADAVDVYVTQAVLHLDGDVDTDRLHRATNDLLAHHRSLRSAFVQTSSGAVVAVVPERVDVPWRVVEVDDSAQTAHIAAAEKLVPFDMSVAPLLRVVLVGHPDGASVVITNHHILFDGWSGPLVMADLLALYATGAAYTGLAGSSGNDFADYARRVGRADHEAGLDAWRDVLAPIAEPTLVAAQVEATADTMPRDLRVPLGADLTEAIEGLSRRSGATVSTVLQFAWALLVSRYTGNRVVTFGETVSGRPADLDGVESMVGLFINTLPAVVDVDPNAQAVDVLAALQADKVKVLDHQHIGLPELTALTGLPTLFDTLTVYESYPVDTDSLENADTESMGAGLTIRGAEVTDATHYPLNLGAAPTADGILLTLKYMPAAFSDGQAQVFADALGQILTVIAADPERRVGDIPLVAHESLAGAVLPPPADAVSPARFVDMLAARDLDPAHPAIIAGDEVISYAEFEARTNRVARRLIAEGVGAGDVVAVVIDRSVESVTAVWGAVKTGAAFVAIDPTHPDERIAGMLDDTRSPIGITVPGHVDRLSGFDTRWLLVDDLAASGVGEDDVTDAERNGIVHLDDLAYLIFTSGTTGRPKAASNINRGLATLADRLAQITGTRTDHEHTRILHLSSPSFDASFFEMIWALGAGHTMVVSPASDYAGPALDTILREHRITDLVLTPSVLATLDVGNAVDLRNLIVCGEACPQELSDEWTSAGKNMFNFYGPSEATVISSTATLRPGKPVNIGTSVRGFTGYVLDSRLQPVPHGFVGELYLSAPAGLGRGYLRRHGLTAERFVADPFAGDGGRMYATGDLVRINDAAELEFAGRADFQVKIAGQRIELGEIETVLREQPGVVSAVVVGIGEPANALAAYVVGGDLTVDDLRTAARHRLPAFMVPASIMVIDEIPINNVGKLDRRALPAPEFADAEHVAPTTPDEETVAAVFADVLGTDLVSVTASFFDLGGNSLSATRLVARVSEALGVDVSVRDVFGSPSVRDLVAEVSGNRAALEAITAVHPRPERIPVSFAQQRMWFINQLQPDAATYNVPAVVSLSGPLDAEALHAALLDVIGRHEVLRTSFPSDDGVPFQQVHDIATAKEMLDWRVVTDTSEVERVVTAGFDLARGLPIRGRLLTTGDDEHVLALVAHHIAADGESVRPLVADLISAYAARSENRAPVFVPLDVQYADFALWQHRVLGSPDDPRSVLGGELAYWTDRLAGLPDVLRLPTDRPRPEVASHRGATVPLRVPADVAARVAAFAAQRSVTPFMVIHTALAAVLARLSGECDVAIATPTAGRGRREIDPLVGMFVNTLVLRTTMDPDDSFDGLLTRARAADVDAFAHATVPFEAIVEAVNPTRSEAFSPLAQVILSFGDSGDSGPVELGDLTVRPVDAPEKPAQFDLAVELAAGSGDWTGSLIYATELFDASTVARFADMFVTALDAGATAPSTPVSALVLGDGPADLPAPNVDTVNAGRSLVGLFADTVAEHGSNSAVSDGARALDYTELNARSSAIAASLQHTGVLPGDLVAVATDRSVDLASSILGVLKVGAGYLPLDTSNPEDRLRFIVEDAMPSAVIVDASTAGLGLWSSLPPQVAVVTVDDLVERGTGADVDPPTIQPDARAYVIYTSGSTGRPKGVEVTHRDVVTLMDAAADDFVFESTDVWTMFHSYAFDFSVWELWGPLLTGGRLVVVDRLLARDPGAFVRFCADESVTVLSLTPSAFYQFAQARRDVGDVDLSLRYLVFGGEELNFEYVRRWFDDFPAGSPSVATRSPSGVEGPVLVNMYGITETTVHVTFRELDPATVRADDASFVGRPLSSLGLCVLDSHLRPVPDGVVGEMYVTGGQLAQGYLNRPGLSSERFVANPFGPAGSRMYRTGDLARRVGDDIAYLGRGDAQVQLRGYRIEYGEIETAMAAADGVTGAAASVVDMPGRGEQLIGYVVTDVVVDAAAIRAAVGRAVPAYMVPDAIVAVDDLPLTANGKLDRGALPVPNASDAVTSVDYVAPANPVETAIAEVFADLLGVERVSATASFFDVGGNSLSATRVRSRLSERNGLVVELAWLFSDPTPRELARRLQEGGAEANDVVIALRSDGSRAPLFCVHPAGGLAWFYGGLLPYLPDRPVYGLQDPHVVAGEDSFTDIAELADRYVDEIRAVQPEGPYNILGWSIGGVIAFAMANRLEREGESVGYLGVMDAQPDDPESIAAAVQARAERTGADADEMATDEVMDVLGGWRTLFDLDDDVTAESTEDLTELIRSQIAGMGLFGEGQVEAIMDSFASAPDLAVTLRPEPFAGRVQVFVATADKADPESVAGAWAPHVEGVDAHYVQTHHLGMTDAESLAVIGPVIDRALE
ncbi:non-ribosomal peptide synthase domain TIGR01720/amino acid adenylation domain-containing protein [Gordonia malaquae]|uniref:Putative non-ribosomal peptide synthetase n=1 Tax=Gordonia malaquae NBRC 108250 TaxID=1223542 RepID=M3UG15_GORML|nr:non-ribosomal peptide synthetase [Gordonia malaquae]GAC78165.1 putative non-ribosomal peptide synthetase [Gordonia malaquae NBRC 108250]SED96200.1 non-ribosomal peptide synthase domain TIGR01720/amino acid adenylation domain-containing protein [Gordonia malaquae]